ncbi:MAG: hypothetical protein ACYSWU_19165 [Planctomycetota bacterium]
MERNDKIKRMGKSLFPTAASPIAADYLAFLAKRVPENLAEHLYSAGEPDISMPSQRVHIEDLMRPLSSKVFPCEKLDDIASLLGFIVIGHATSFEENGDAEDPYTMLYAASLYVYCFLSAGGVPEHSGYVTSMRIMAAVPLRLDLESRLQVCRFLGSLVPMIPTDDSTDEPAPLSTLLLALSVIVGSVVSDLSVFTEQAMRSEHIEQEWRAEKTSEPEFEDISALRQLVAEMYSPSGKVRQGENRFLLANAGGTG